MGYNVLKSTIIYVILIICASLAMIACPEVDESTKNSLLKDRFNPIHFIISDGTKEIPENKYKGKGYTKVTIPNSVETIGERAFAGNKLTELTIGNKVETIGEGAFADNKLASLIIPDSVTTIGKNAFKGNELTKLTIGNKVETIGEGAFVGNTLTKVNLSRTLFNKYGKTELDNRFGRKATYYKLTATENGLDPFHLIIVSDTTEIQDNEYRNKGYTKVTIPDSVITIGESAFVYNKLKSLTIPNSVVTIGLFAFIYNKELTKVNLSKILFDKYDEAELKNRFGDKVIYVSLDDKKRLIPRSADKGHLIVPFGTIDIPRNKYKGKGYTKVTIPNSVVTIGMYAFEGNKIRSVIIGNRVGGIQPMAFYNNELINISFPNSLIYISDFAFSKNKLSSVTIPDHVNHIGRKAFTDNRLTSVTFSDSVKEMWIGLDAFENYGGVHQNNIRTVTLSRALYEYIIKQEFKKRKYTIYTPFFETRLGVIFRKKLERSKITYYDHKGKILRTSDGLDMTAKEPFHLIIPPGDTTLPSSIPWNKYHGKGYTKVTIPDSVIIIDDSALKGNQLRSVTIPNSVQTIKVNAFKDNKLVSVIIGNKIWSLRIEEGAFQNNKIKSFTIPKSMRQMWIGNYAFYNNGLKIVTLSRDLYYKLESRLKEAFGSGITYYNHEGNKIE